MSGRPPVVPPGSPPDVRFRALVDSSAGPDACHPWTRGRDKDGYGKFTLMVDGKQKNVRAHRYAFFLKHGRFPEGLGLHTCDNPPCCNADHIEDGDQKKNRQDCADRGRVCRGERVSLAKLTEDDVREMRRRFAAGESKASIARAFGVRKNAAREAILGVTWSHVR